MAIIQLAVPRRAPVPAPGATSTDLSSPRRLSRAELVARIDDFLRDNIKEPISVGALSKMAGVSERTLRSAFHDVLGISPKQYAIRQRLDAVHHALSEANPDTTTVTDVAMTFGFFELGRFAGRYRETFGEVPSRTLRGEADAVADRRSWPEQVA